MNKKTSEDISFGEWLRQRRRILDLTQQELADQAGCARITLRRIESGGLKPSKELADILLAKLGIPGPERPDWILFARGLAGLPNGTVSSSPLQEPRTNLPVSITSFVGREVDIERIRRRLSEHRLVTLTGAGGIGKTRLAQEVGRGLLQAYPNGVWFVELASLGDPALVPQTVAGIFGIRNQSDRPLMEVLIQVLRNKRTLLILDNCEHLLDACAEFSDKVLKNCPELKILATSREALGVVGEALYLVPALAVPDIKDIASPDKPNEYEALRLFDERAQLVNMDFALTMENLPFIALICARLDGIPLAIELVAARIQTFSPEQIASQLENRFELLTTRNARILPKHQSLRTSMEWSWNLLSEPEKRFMRHLSIFAGGWTLESAEAICEGDVPDVISALIKKSLMLVNKQSRYETRYRFHEIVRQYASEKLDEAGEDADIRTRHLNYFVRLSEQAETALRGPAQAEWMSRLNDERDNIRTAVEWANETNPEAGLYLLGRLYRFWESFDIREGAHWLAKLVENPNSTTYPHASAKALLAQGRLLTWLEQFLQARSATELSLDLFRACGDQEGEIDSLLSLGYLADVPGNASYSEQSLVLAKSLGDIWRQAEALNQLSFMYSGDKQFACLEQAIMWFRQCGDWSRLAMALSQFGRSALFNGDFELARQKLDEAMRMSDQLNDKDAKAFLLSNQGRMTMAQGDYVQASKYLQEALKLWEEIGTRMTVLWSRTFLGYLALYEGNLTVAHANFREMAREFLIDQSENGVAFTLEGMAGLFIAVGKPEYAARLVGWADITREKIRDTRPRLEQADVDKIISACVAKLGREKFSDLYVEGRKMTLDEVVAYALHEE